MPISFYSLRKKLFCIVLSAGVLSNAHAQPLSESLTRSVDRLFSQWDSSGTPGYAIGIVRNDSLIYAKGYGTANLESGAAITPQTPFHMASVSKQFTAFSILLLAQQGKLSLEDDIRKYLSWFPDLGYHISIRQLLNHTSGVRDQWQLLAMAGTRIDDIITQDQIIKILSKQRALNFTPGDAYAYSNSGFTMLAEIVHSITGQTLRQFTDSAIFAPLGMNDTHFHDDCGEIVPGRSYSYFKERPGKYRNAILSYSVAGATSLFCNVTDMAKWLMNFYLHRLGNADMIRELTRKGMLNNGKELDYALGISVTDYRGWTYYSHNGADAGYRTAIGVFPELKLGFIVFSNTGDALPGMKASQLADLFVTDHQKTTVPVTQPKYADRSVAILKDTVTAKKNAGEYLGDDGARFGFFIRDRMLYWRSGNNAQNLLVPVTADSFEVYDRPFIRFAFSKGTSGSRSADQYWTPSNHRHLQQYDTAALSDKALTAYTGTYYSPELDCNYRIELKNHHLYLVSAKYNDEKITMYGDAHMTTDTWYMGSMDVVKERGRITGFEVNSDRVKRLLFKKVE